MTQTDNLWEQKKDDIILNVTVLVTEMNEIKRNKELSRTLRR